MAQLVKLQDYISRYEQDIFTYPSRFVRLKKQQWERTKENWEKEGVDASNLSFAAPLNEWREENNREKRSLLGKLSGMFKPLEKEAEEPVEEVGKSEDPLEFSAAFKYKPATVDELKQQFLDQLFRFQLKWASSTLVEKSYFSSKYFFEEKLKFFLQRFPDTFLVLYNPIFLLKKAPVEAEILLLTPTETWCISFIEEEDSAVFIGSNDRFWLKLSNKGEKKVLNPLLSLNRTERIVRNIYKLYKIELPIHKLIISRNGYIDYPNAPFGIQFAEARNFNQWFQNMRSLRSPLKHMQLNGAQALLQYCQTSSTKRLEWEAPKEVE
ncbi:nuclease-related domain-containing protein [Bacillota bacterium Lsc_1132]